MKKIFVFSFILAYLFIFIVPAQSGTPCPLDIIKTWDYVIENSIPKSYKVISINKDLSKPAFIEIIFENKKNSQKMLVFFSKQNKIISKKEFKKWFEKSKDTAILIRDSYYSDFVKDKSVKEGFILKKGQKVPYYSFCTVDDEKRPIRTAWGVIPDYKGYRIIFSSSALIDKYSLSKVRNFIKSIEFKVENF